LSAEAWARLAAEWKAQLAALVQLHGTLRAVEPGAVAAVPTPPEISSASIKDSAGD
jgi:hypothetical protein